VGEIFSVGDWVRRRRKALALTQDALASRAGCAVSMIRKIEADERKPSRQIAALLASALEIPAAEREQFLQAARAELAVDKLASSPLPSAPPPPTTALPAGTVTFLFTDIAGSTRLWEQYPTAMQRALARHDALLRQVIAAHQGVMVKGTGDGLHAAFARAPDAVAAALAAQHGLRAEDWGVLSAIHVRMALHTGVSEERDGDYFGPPLNRAARLLTTGHGGQVLLSRATAELVRDHLPPDVSLRDLGEHRLKDLARSEQIFQLLAPDLPSIFPPPHTLEAARSNLPTQATPLIGREQELAQVTALLARADVRLITLTGPGGTGKTRLALQLAADLADRYRDGVVFVDLAPLAAADQVLPTVAQVLGVKELVGTTLQARVCEYLQLKHMLLLLDNFEQVLDAAPLVAALLRAAPHLSLLVTSRVVLHLSGEHEYAVPPLALPPTTDERRTTNDATRDAVVSGQSSVVGQYAAIQLFVARAQATQSAFALTEANAAAVAGICRRLDGLPLAIELAAARIKLFPPKALQERLSDRFRLLTGGARDLPARQQTLRAAIDWSYNLLAPAEQRLFWRLGVFVGGWTIEAAEAVCEDKETRRQGDKELIDPRVSRSPGLPVSLSVLDGLRALVDHSLVRQEAGSDGAPRFRRLETIREYARELLAASGEAVELQRRHATFFLDLAEQAETYNYGPEDYIWMERLAADYDNLHAALVWSSSATGDLATALRLVSSLLKFWLNRRPLSEALYWIESLLKISSAGVLPDLQAKALSTAGTLALFKGDTSHAEPLLTQALALYESLADDRGCSEILNHLGILKASTGHLTESLTYQEASIQRAQQAQSEIRAAWALSEIGSTYILMGDYERGVTSVGESLALGALHGSAHHAVSTQFASALFHRGEDARAVVLLDEALPVLRAETGAIFICIALIWRAQIAREHGDDNNAEALLLESLGLAQDNGAAVQLAYTHHELGLLALKRGETLPAQAHFRESLTLFRAQHNPWCVTMALLGTGLTTLLLGDRTVAALDYAESVALLRDWRENMLARQAALVIGLSGLLLARTFDAAQVARIWGLVTALEPLTAGRRVTPPFLSLPQPDPARRDAAIAEARTLLGPNAFEAAWAAGQALTLEQAVEEALMLDADLATPERRTTLDLGS
jgi:predicted ATPase/class 3 adenylate cyclase